MLWGRRTEERQPPGFDRSRLLEARRKTWSCLRAIAESVRPGMLEEDAVAGAERILLEHGAEKNWHRVYVRFGRNTLLPYGTTSVPGITLTAEDIYFIDIGPVFDGYEGDAGDTFTTGSSPILKQCKQDVRRIFSDVKRHWKTGNTRGQELYAYAEARARERGWILNLNVDGHRLSQFPHHVLFKGGLATIGYAPVKDAWMLELQIKHPVEPFGAFYEDLLTEETLKAP